MIYTVTFNPAIDYVVRLDRELQVGDVNRARGEDCVLGGKGINVSGVLAQLGCESVALGFVAGETGAWLERGLAAQGLKTDFVHLDHGMTRINVKIKAGQETELNGAGPDIPEAAMQALEQKLDALQKDDILVLAGSIPANRARGEDCVLGGKGINVSGVLAQLGCESVALGFVAGETGAWLERGLAAQGLKTDFVHLDHGMTRINVKIKAGQETELNGAGPDIPEAAMQALEQKLDALQKDDILVLAGSIPASLAQTTYERLLARLEGRGIRAVVDATRDLLVNVLPYKPFLIKPNNHELSEITGVRLTNDKEIAAAAHMMQDKGARNVLVSMAGDGALLLDEHGTVYRIGCPRGKVVNSVGAGDSMVAGFVAGYQQSGGDYEAALRLGTACGSATAFSLGLATKADIDALLATM